MGPWLLQGEGQHWHCSIHSPPDPCLSNTQRPGTTLDDVAVAVGAVGAVAAVAAVVAAVGVGVGAAVVVMWPVDPSSSPSSSLVRTPAAVVAAAAVAKRWPSSATLLLLLQRLLHSRLESTAASSVPKWPSRRVDFVSGHGTSRPTARP